MSGFKQKGEVSFLHFTASALQEKRTLLHLQAVKRGAADVTWHPPDLHSQLHSSSKGREGEVVGIVVVVVARVNPLEMATLYATFGKLVMIPPIGISK